jgi:thioredoxin-like negative regulator of GroEL
MPRFNPPLDYEALLEQWHEQCDEIERLLEIIEKLEARANGAHQ